VIDSYFINKSKFAGFNIFADFIEGIEAKAAIKADKIKEELFFDKILN